MNKRSKKTRLSAVAAVLSLCLAGSAMAGGGWDRGHDRRNDDGPRYSQRFDRDHDRRDGHGGYHRADPRPHAQWRRGGYLPENHRRQEVRDWRAYQLQQPPSGYHWVSANGDFVLAALAGGLIAQIVAGR
ncbi:MAG: hypothetical protein EOP82_18395 [Variovorax sp.]|nr:MAG: hypothetical protein EOP82_18395 [Variovorax sp.]